MSDKNETKNQEETIRCVSCRREVKTSDSVALNGEILCIDCYDLLETSKDTH